MKQIVLASILLIIIGSAAKAQNNTTLYGTWKTRTATFYFADRPSDDVDNGDFSFTSTSTIANCDCTAVTSIPFDWITKDGLLKLYYGMNGASQTTSVKARPGASATEIDFAKKNCPITAKQALDEFKKTFKLSQDYKYTLSGSTLSFSGMVLSKY
ncbi:MAG: hypothetical protein V4539_13805 [Bacteroidota bacterium]